MILQILAVVGALSVFYFIKSTYQFCTLHFVKPAKPLLAYKQPKSPHRDAQIRGQTAGEEKTESSSTWALVTGSSAGIGLGIAQELILQGFSVILHGYLPDELASAKERLLEVSSASSARATSPSPQVEIKVLDARTATEEDLKDLVKSISHLDVRILVNNVGGNPVREPNFLEIKDLTSEDMDMVLNQNIRFMARLTRLMIPLLGTRHKSGADADPSKALIVNLASVGMVGTPWLVMYGATKAFNHAFSAGLGRELKLNAETRHIDCLCIMPGEVKTQGNSRGLPRGIPDWEAFGREVVWKIDGAVRKGLWDLRPNWWHDVEWGFLHGWILGWVPGLDWRPVVEKGVVDAIRNKRDAWWEYKGFKA